MAGGGNAYPSGALERKGREELIPADKLVRELSPWDQGRKIARPVLVLAVIGALVFLQARAQSRQIDAGYRFMEHEPGRVPFSWDMFAVKIQRCSVRFTVPLKSANGTHHIRSFGELSPKIEWNPVFNDWRHYASYAGQLCDRYALPTEESGETPFIRLTCFDELATRHFYDYRCK